MLSFNHKSVKALITGATGGEKNHKMGEVNQINQLFQYRLRLLKIKRIKAKIKRLEKEREKATSDMINSIFTFVMAAICIIFYTYFIK